MSIESFVCPSWSSNIGISMFRGPFENITGDFILAFQQCLKCLIYLTWMVLEMEGKSSLYSICLVSIHVVHRYYRNDTTAAWKKLHFILLYKPDFHVIDNQSIAVFAFANLILMSFSVDEMLLLRQVNLSAREPPFSVEMSPF